MKDVSVIVYTVADLDAAKKFFSTLIGADPYVDSPQYVGFKSGATEIGLVPSGGKREPSTVPFWDVDDIQASLQALVDVGGVVTQPATDVGYGLLVASVKDPGGALVGLRQQPKR